jgi:ribosome-associated protein
MRDVEILKQPVELYKILKFEGIAGSGGAAKSMVGEGHVLVNGTIETRKRRKIVAGDVIEIAEEQFRVTLK